MTNLFSNALKAIRNGNYDKDLSLVAAVEQKDDSGLTAFQSSLMLGTSINDASIEDDSENYNNVALKAAIKASAAVGMTDRTSLYDGIKSAAIEQGYGPDLTSPLDASVEHFDGRNVDVFQAATFAYNLEAATQDEFSEAFFPTVIGDISTAGIKVKVRSTQVITDFLRNNDKSDAKKFNRKSLLTAISDQNGVLAGDHLKLVPVVGSGFDTQLVTALKSTVHYDAAGEDVETAPFKVGTTLNVIGASQSSTLLAKGVMDNTDTLDATVPLKNLYFKTSEANKHLVVDISNLQGAVFVAGQRGDSKDLVLSVKTQLVINLGATKVFEGTEIAAIAALPANYKAVFDVEILGQGNAVDGELSVHVGKFQFSGVRDATGKVVPETDAAYTAIKTEADALEAVGVDLEARLTNSNIRRNGIHLTSKPSSEILPVRAMTPIYTTSPVAGQNIGDHDGAFLTDLLSVSGILSNFSAVKTLKGFASFMSTQIDVAPEDINTGTIGGDQFKPFYHFRVLVLSDYVDSNRGGERAEDIKATIINNIATDVATMLSESGYSNYATYVKRTNKTDIVIGTFPALAAYLGDYIDLGNGAQAKVVSTTNSDISDRIFITIGDSAANTNEVKIDRFGSRLFLPSLVSSVDVTENGATKSKLVVNPMFNHVVTCPVLIEYKVSGLNDVLKKVIGFRKSI